MFKTIQYGLLVRQFILAFKKLLQQWIILYRLLVTIVGYLWINKYARSLLVNMRLKIIMRTYINRPSTNIRFQFITENIFPLSVFYSEYCYAFSKLQRTYLRFQFSTAHIYTLQFSTANIATLQFSTANIATLQFSTANISTLQFITANISTLQFSTANIFTLQFSTANISTLQFSTANISTLQFSTANINTLQFSTANISTLQFSTANIATLQFSTANISTLQFSTANISIYLQCTMYRLRVRVFNVHISVNLYTFLIIANAIFVYCLVLILSRFLCAWISSTSLKLSEITYFIVSFITIQVVLCFN